MQTSSPKQTPKDRQKLMEWYKSLIEVKIKDIIEFHSRFEKYVHFKMVMVEYQNKTEKGYLIDTCLKAQDEYVRMIEKYLK